jgi:mannose-6-phosphate isomerase-like protein (cupin superfamily)
LRQYSGRFSVELVQLDPSSGFEILAGTERSQAASMVLAPGTSTGGPDNRHPESDQWLYVISGDGSAVVEGTERELGAGSLLLIEAGEAHEIKSAGDSPLQTLSFYAPAVY